QSVQLCHPDLSTLSLHDALPISHFIEHMFFKGASRFKNTKEVSEAIDGVGGQFNAFTGKEYAGYYVKLAKENKEVAFDVIADMRSEEHTSELQSRENLVCRLLLE